VDWSKLPDVGAVALLVCAFASVEHHNHTPVSRLWLVGWAMVVLHFSAFVFLPSPGVWGIAASIVGIASLTWAGLLFQTASVPYRRQPSSQWIQGLLLGTNTLYVVLLVVGPVPAWILNLVAVLFGAGPLAVTLFSLRTVNTAIRWSTVSLYCALSLFLLSFQNRPGNGSDLALNAVLCTVYLGSCINFLHTYRRATTGAFITIAGFLAWSAVFVVGPAMEAFLPHVQVENEVWNLPKYVVAVGMILLMLENQIEHNKYLALHDELTALPNRRLFQDRLASALERARRTGAQTALLLVDLDHFKEVNDTLGHHAGDRLLKHVATVFSGRVRRSDTVARTGGDEFSLILEEPTSRAEADKVGSSLLEMLKQPLQLGDRSVQVSASIGIAVFPEDAHDMESLCIAADRRMYSQKYGNANWNADPASTRRTSPPALEAPDTSLQTAQYSSSPIAAE
jgi:diguanylate cyclase (GGDEF)-like protein